MTRPQPRILPRFAAFIRALRKAELHLHGEGTNEADFAFAKAAKNKVRLQYSTPDELRAAYAFTDLDDFLALYYLNCSVLVTEQDFYDLIMAYLERVSADNVVHTEIFIDPQSHTERGIHMGAVINPVYQALQDGGKKFGMTTQLIPCFLRHLPPEAAMQMLDEALPFADKILGFGLDSSERKFAPVLFDLPFQRVRAEGLLTFAHAGEEKTVPWEYVEQAVDVLQVQRIDHGDACLQSLPLARRLAKIRKPLTLCPFSRLRLKNIKSLADHQVKLMLQLGLCASLHSDDPAYFPGPAGYGGYIADNYVGTAEAVDLTAEEVTTLCNNSFEASIMAETLRAEHIAFNNRLLADYLSAA